MDKEKFIKFQDVEKDVKLVEVVVRYYEMKVVTITSLDPGEDGGKSETIQDYEIRLVSIGTKEKDSNNKFDKDTFKKYDKPKLISNYKNRLRVGAKIIMRPQDLSKFKYYLSSDNINIIEKTISSNKDDNIIEIKYFEEKGVDRDEDITLEEALLTINYIEIKDNGTEELISTEERELLINTEVTELSRNYEMLGLYLIKDKNDYTIVLDEILEKTITIGKGKNTINFYYRKLKENEKEVKYTVNYLENKTEKILAKKEIKRFILKLEEKDDILSKEIKERAKTISGYRVLDRSQKTIVITKDTEILFEVTFYYEKRTPSVVDPVDREEPEDKNDGSNGATNGGSSGGGSSGGGSGNKVPEIPPLVQFFDIKLNKEDHKQYIQGYPDESMSLEGNITRE